MAICTNNVFGRHGTLGRGFYDASKESDKAVSRPDLVAERNLALSLEKRACEKPAKGQTDTD